MRASKRLGALYLSVPLLLFGVGCTLEIYNQTGGPCAVGIVCPTGTYCAAAQQICILITEKCGNAVVDPGEACDDGNRVDGDGCSHDCKSIERCGNGVVDPGEVCDDGNRVDGDGCSHDCRSLEICGNGTVDTAVGEVCDDGANNGTLGDRCSLDCTLAP